MASPFVGTYTSFSGADLVVSFGPKVIGELQQISYAITREKVPVFTLGSPNPRSFSRGKRGIAGSLIFSAFDRDALLEEMKEIWRQIAPPAMFTAAGNLAKGRSEDFSAAADLVQWNKAATNTFSPLAGASLSRAAIQSVVQQNKPDTEIPEGYKWEYSHVPDYSSTEGLPITTWYLIPSSITVETSFSGSIVYTIGETEYTQAYDIRVIASDVESNPLYELTGGAEVGFSGTGGIKLSGTRLGSDYSSQVYTPPGFKLITDQNIQYVDQLPPFDVTLTFANEYGQAAFQKFYDMEMLNEASGVSVDSVVMEKQYTWVGRNMSPLYKGIYTRDDDGTIQTKDVKQS